MNEHTPGPWHWDDGEDEDMPKLMAPSGEVCNFGNCEQYYPTAGIPPNAADACLIAAAPELLDACANARDMLATDRQAFVDCQRVRGPLTEEPIAHGLVFVEEDVWIKPEDAEALGDYDKAISLIDAAIAKATGSAS